MSIRMYSAIIFASVAVAGCARDSQFSMYADAVNAEKRWVEDKFYELEFDYKEAVEALKACREENEKLRKELGRGPAETTGEAPPDENRAVPSEPEIEAPRIELGTPDEPRIEAPKIDLGIPLQPGSNPGQFELPRPRTKPQPAPPSQPTQPPLDDLPNLNPGGDPESEGQLISLPSDTYVTHIVLNPFLTGGQDFDSNPGNDGISVVIEPRNADEAFVPLAAKLSVVALDPAEVGERAHFARWDIDSIQADQQLRNSASVRGIHLNLPWPAAPPKHSRLHIFVRYETADGRRLQTDREIFLAPDGQLSRRWTPRLAGHPEDPASAPQQKPGSGMVLSSESDSQQPSAQQDPGNGKAVSPRATTPLPADDPTPQRPQWRPFR